MADSYIDFGVDVPLEQTDGIFSGLTLDYLSTAHFGVVITNGVSPYVKTTLTSSQFTVTTSPTLTVTLDFAEIPEYSVLAAADSVRISRTTPVDALQRSFTDGSVLKASDLTAQHKQLLFGLQEQVDGGIGSLPVDTDGLLDAGSKKIKNLGTASETHHAVTKEYVDALALYGAAFGGSDPQYWTFITDDDVDIVGDNRVFDFPESAPPATTVDNMFLVEIGGVIQDPAGYNVTLETDGDYQILLIGAAVELDEGETIIVRNFGVSRNVLGSAYTNLDDTSDALVIERLSSETTANLVKVIDETTAHLVSIDYAGTIRVGSDTDEDTNTSITSSKVEVGDYNTDGSDGVSIETSSNKGILGISGIDTAPDGDAAITTYRGTTQIFKVAYNGDITTTGGLAASGAISGTTGTFSGAISGTAGTFTGDVLMSASTKIEIGEYGSSSAGAQLDTYSDRGRLHLSTTLSGGSSAMIFVRNASTSTPVFEVNSDGHVGIGGEASDSTYALKVVGKIYASGAMYCDQPPSSSDSSTRVPTTGWVTTHVADSATPTGMVYIDTIECTGQSDIQNFPDITVEDYSKIEFHIHWIACTTPQGVDVACEIKRGSTWSTIWSLETNVYSYGYRSGFVQFYGTDYTTNKGHYYSTGNLSTAYLSYDGMTFGPMNRNGTVISKMRMNMEDSYKLHARISRWGLLV